MSFKFSANIGFIIRAAAAAGFDAVECHFPYDYAQSEIKSALDSTGMSMVGLNTALGPDGNFGMAAIAGQENLARELIDQAISYAAGIGAQNVNVVAGLTGGAKNAQEVYINNLEFACDAASVHGITIMIEPLNPRAVANYHFSTVEQAVEIIDSVDADNMKLMFDFFHAQVVQGDLETLIKEYKGYFAHIQISAVHDRGEPDAGEINYPYMLGVLKKEGYGGYIGAEYKPRSNSVESGLDWLREFREL